jgi:hypothetical protein
MHTDASATWTALGLAARHALWRLYATQEPPGLQVSEVLARHGCIRPCGRVWELTPWGRDVVLYALESC